MLYIDRPGQLMKFVVGDKGIQLNDGYPVGVDLQFKEFVKVKRRADLWSKACPCPLTIKAL